MPVIIFSNSKAQFELSNLMFTQQQRLGASDAANGDSFGFSVAINDTGTDAVIGAIGDDTPGNQSGAAYFFTRSGTTWSQIQKLDSSDLQAADSYGASAAMNSDGTTAVVGAVNEAAGGLGAGAAYVFTKSGGTWSEQQKLTASDAASNDEFAFDVSISSDGNTILVGARDKNSKAGAAYVFTRSGGVWSEQQKLLSNDIAGGDRFGSNVSLSNDGNLAIIGARGEFSSAGAAYVFSRSGGVWTQDQKLVASTRANSNAFGEAVDISGDGSTIIVGESGHAAQTGRVAIFTKPGASWSIEQEVFASDDNANSSFGDEVQLNNDGTIAVIAASQDDTFGTNSGDAYLFTKTGGVWSENQTFTGSNISGGDRFGAEMSITGDGKYLIVGAFSDDNVATDAGSAFIFISNIT